MGATTMSEVGIGARRARAPASIARRKRCRASGSPRCRRSACGPRCATRTTTCRCIERASMPPASSPTTSAPRATLRACRSRCKTDLRDHYPFGMFARPRRRTRAAARVVGHHRQADRGRLHAPGHRHLGRPDGALDGLRRRAARRRRPQRLRLRPVHRRARRALRRRAPRRGRRADVGRLDRAADRADRRFRRARAVRDAVVRAGDRRGRRAAGRRPPRERARSRPLRRRAVERGDAPRDRDAARIEGHRHLRPVRDHGAGRRLRMRMPGRTARLGGSLPVRGDRPRDRRAGARGRTPANWSSPR